LLRAAERCVRVAEQAGGVALLIDAKDARIAQRYESYGAPAFSMRLCRWCCPFQPSSRPCDIAGEAAPVAISRAFPCKKSSQRHARAQSFPRIDSEAAHA